MLLSDAAIADAVETLTAEDFYKPAHATIFTTITHLFSKGTDADAVTVAGELDRNNALESIGGVGYIHTIISKTPTSANVGYYANIVKEKAALRQLIHAGTQIVQYGYSGIDGAEISAVIDRAQQEIMTVGDSAQREDYSIFADLIPVTMDELDALDSGTGGLQGIRTGFRELDELTNGLRGGQMVIVAARPGVGKSTLGLDFMRSCSIKQGVTSAIFSLEMSKEEIMMRILSAEANISLARMRGGKMQEDEWGSLVHTVGFINETPMFIDDSPNLTMMEIRAKARRLKQKHELGLVVVDYLQLMSSGKRVESRQQEVSEFSRQLKLLAKELDVPVVAISQLNRGVEQRGEDAEPRVSDLRESGSLEQDADMVMLINRPDSSNRDHARAGEADIILAKHRGGPIGKVTVAHQLQYSKFSEPTF